MKQLRPLKPGGPVYAEDYNLLVAEVVRLSKMTVDGPFGLEFSQTAGGPQLLIPKHPRRIRARIITSNTLNVTGCSLAYSWWEQRPLQGGCWEDIPEAEGGRRGDAATEPAFEANAIPLTEDVNVWLYPGFVKNLSTSVEQSWYFDAPATCCTPDSCCDIDDVESLCVTFASVSEVNIPPGSVAPSPGAYTATNTGDPNAGHVGTFDGSSGSGGFNWQWLFFFFVRCIDGVPTLVLTPQSGSQMFVPLTVNSCDPVSMSYAGPTFDWQPNPGPGTTIFRFGANSITVIGPGACPS